MKKRKKNNIIGKKVKLYRENKNWSYEYFSKRLRESGVNIKPNVLKNIEFGMRKVTINEFVGISECLEVMMCDLINEQ